MGKRRQYMDIPENIREQADKIIADFNMKVIKNPKIFYSPRYRKNCLYLDRKMGDTEGPICRLKYQGKIDNWDFAIYKYSKEHYDPEEFFFPGMEHVDGTLEGAMKAGIEAYPASDYDEDGSTLIEQFLSFLLGKKYKDK